MEINIKAVFFDVDGTLISHKDGGVPESTKEALRLLKKGYIIYYLKANYLKCSLLSSTSQK